MPSLLLRKTSLGPTTLLLLLLLLRTTSLWLLLLLRLHLRLLLLHLGRWKQGPIFLVQVLLQQTSDC